MRLADDVVVGVEALVRWEHPRLGQILPDEFIPIAEHTGLIVALTADVLAQALDQCRRWREQGRPLGVALNISTRSLLAQAFPQEVADALALSGVPADQLTLEITESSVMADPEGALAVLQELHGLGVRLSVDDFGTGYSSLAYLQRLPVHEVKVDKGFVFTLASDTSSVAIVRAVVELGHSLGLQVVAEGMEDSRGRQLLSELGCDIGQGYLVSRPVSATALERWLGPPADRAAGRRPYVRVVA